MTFEGKGGVTSQGGVGEKDFGAKKTMVVSERTSGMNRGACSIAGKGEGEGASREKKKKKTTPQRPPTKPPPQSEEEGKTDSRREEGCG